MVRESHAARCLRATKSPVTPFTTTTFAVRPTPKGLLGPIRLEPTADLPEGRKLNVTTHFPSSRSISSIRGSPSAASGTICVRYRRAVSIASVISRAIVDSSDSVGEILYRIYRGRLLLRHAMQRAQAPYKVYGVDADDFAIRKHFGQNLQCDSVFGVMKCWHQNQTVSDVEIRVARR